MVLVAGVLGILVAMPFQGSSSFAFQGKGYVHRYSKGDLHEFTPKAQPDLKKWTDMMTLNLYRKITDGEGLAKAANSVLDTYKAHKAVVVRTNSVPRTTDKAAEYLIVALFPRPDFIEASFTRFQMRDGTGTSLVYGHRIYGKKAGDAMSAWLQKNGEQIEKELMGLKGYPPIPRK